MKKKIEKVIVNVDKKEVISKYMNGEINILSDEYVYTDFDNYSIGCILDCSVQELRDIITNDKTIISKLVY